MSDLYIPEKTRAHMVNGAAKGNRHDTMFKIAMPLLGQGMSPDAVFAQIRATIPDADKTDREIRDVIEWCLKKQPEPSGYGDEKPSPAKRQWNPRPAEKQEPKKTPLEAVRHCIGDAWMSETAWTARSKVPIPSDPAGQMRALLLALYEPEERVNLVKEFFIGEDKKAKPHGGGKTMTRDEWLNYIADRGVPKSESGIWIRPNPCGGGTGKDGSITDADVLAWRFAFLESDILSTAEQLSFYARTGLPIAALITSGGENSCHAWVRVDAKNLEDYREKVKNLYAVVEAYGMDKANKNASRLSRLPGARRTVGAFGDGMQRLIYLDGECRGDVLTEQFLSNMATVLRHPPPAKMPMKDSVFAASDRYDDLMRNKGKNGLMTGFTAFDTVAGGLKKKRVYVVAAESKCGKSTFAFNILNHVSVHNRLPSALFSMEMDRDEITDILVALNGCIDRNVFNTGNFYQSDVERAQTALMKIQEAPLYIFDEPNQTTESMRSECVRLISGGVDLQLVCADYLQLADPGPEFFNLPREQQVAKMAKDFRGICKDLNVPVILISQINDDGKLRESRAVGHAAHAVMILEEMDPSNNGTERKLRLKVERARSMPRGEYPILFEVLYSRMSDGDHSVEREKPSVPQGNIRKSRSF